MGWEVHESQQKRLKHREHIAWLKIIRLVANMGFYWVWKTWGLVLCQNAGFGADLKVKRQKEPPCRFGIDDLLGL